MQQVQIRHHDTAGIWMSFSFTLSASFLKSTMLFFLTSLCTRRMKILFLVIGAPRLCLICEMEAVVTWAAEQEYLVSKARIDFQPCSQIPQSILYWSNQLKHSNADTNQIQVTLVNAGSALPWFPPALFWIQAHFPTELPWKDKASMPPEKNGEKERKVMGGDSQNYQNQVAAGCNFLIRLIVPYSCAASGSSNNKLPWWSNEKGVHGNPTASNATYTGRPMIKTGFGFKWQQQRSQFRLSLQWDGVLVEHICFDPWFE